MSISELQDWLLKSGIQQDLRALTRLLARQELDSLLADNPPSDADGVDWPRLLLAGSILARSDSRVHQETALRIATGAVTLSHEVRIADAGAVLFSKLRNFRAVELASERELLKPDLDSRLGSGARLEALRRRMDHEVLVESTGSWIQVNDFQERFWTTAKQKSWLSASAPTASGKTYLVLHWLIDQLKSSKAKIAVYLAPTRALVSEIEKSLAELLTGDASIEVSSLPLRAKYESARTGSKKLVLVYTQERLHLLANVVGDLGGIDLLIVDEAHKIGDNQRGVILQDAVERLVRANPLVRVAFISPATQNPEELLSDAPDVDTTGTVDSDVPTVLQNLIVAQHRPLKTKLWDLTLRNREDQLLIGTIQLASSPVGIKKRLAFVAAAAGKRGGTLVYANGAGEAEAVADLIAQLRDVEPADTEVSDLADLARKTVHPNFALADLLLRGVAFHYGNMPSLMRLEIERLFRAGKIKFLVCTSTLIEGVNLSCRTIVVRGPRKGKGHPMEPHDFWNLAGRAGRWGDEFQGNIICIDPHDVQAWPNGVPDRSRYPIKRESDAVIGAGDSLAVYLEQLATVPLPSADEAERYEQVGGYLLSSYLRSGKISDTNLAARHDPKVIARLEAALGELAAKIEISPELAARHPGVSALAMQRLLDAFRAYKGDVENLLPATVSSDDSYDRFVTIMHRINENLYPAFNPEGLIKLYALVVVEWLKGYSLASMIRRSINWHQKVGRKFKLPMLIRQTMEFVEQIARFRAPKYFSAYVDILHLHLNQIGRDDLVQLDLDIGTQLEFGVSTTTLFSLMELGLSRTTAVALFEKIARDDLTKVECVEWVDARKDQLESMDIPAIVAREAREMLQRSSI